MKSLRLIFSFFLLITTSFLYSQVYSATYVSDHFDGWTDWDGTTEFPDPWGNYNYNSADYSNRTFVDNTYGDAHGAAGKSFRVQWPDFMRALCLTTWAAENKPEFYAGYWHKLSSGFSTGEIMKWFYAPSSWTSGDRTMLSMTSSGKLQLYDGINYTLETTAALSKGVWQEIIIYFKHNTAGNSDGQVRMWIDGVETSFVYTGHGKWTDNLAIDFSATTDNWADWMGFGYQSRNDFPADNISFFDDVIVASTKAEVEAFLGVSGTGPTRSNGQPTGEQPSGTTSVVLSVTTDGGADTCTYGADGDSSGSYPLANSMTDSGTGHTATISGLADGNSYSRNVMCSDGSEANTDPYMVSWSIAAAAVVCSDYDGDQSTCESNGCTFCSADNSCGDDECCGDSAPQCDDQTSCEGAGWNWCTNVCQVDECAGPPPECVNCVYLDGPGRVDLN